MLSTVQPCYLENLVLPVKDVMPKKGRQSLQHSDSREAEEEMAAHYSSPPPISHHWDITGPFKHGPVYASHLDEGSWQRGTCWKGGWGSKATGRKGATASMLQSTVGKAGQHSPNPASHNVTGHWYHNRPYVIGCGPNHLNSFICTQNSCSSVPLLFLLMLPSRTSECGNDSGRTTWWWWI